MLGHFRRCCRNMIVIYSFVHISSLLLFRKAKLRSTPFKEIKKVVYAIVMSLLFAAGHATVTGRVICFLNTHWKFRSLNGVMGVLLGSTCVLFEHPSRQP